MQKYGFTLIETVIYIALVAIVLPGVAYFVIDTTGRQEQLSERVYISQTVALIFDELRYELQAAQNIQITASTLGSDPSSLRFVDRNGVVNTITTASDIYTAGGLSQNIMRLRVTQGGTASWMTGNEVTVSTFQVDPVRNSLGELRGLNVHMVVDPLSMINAAQTAQSLDVTTTILLNSYVQES